MRSIGLNTYFWKGNYEHVFLSLKDIVWSLQVRATRYQLLDEVQGITATHYLLNIEPVAYAQSFAVYCLLY